MKQTSCFHRLLRDTFKTTMKDMIYHFVNFDEKVIERDHSDSETHCENVDRLRLTPPEHGNPIETPNRHSEAKYYRLDQVVFAQPISVESTAEASGDQKDFGEITFVNNVAVKKRHGKRNRYLIDIEPGCLDCPLSDCSKTFTTTTLLKAHIRKVHCATTKYMCEECGAGFTAAYLLKRHSAVHSGSKVQCPMCEKWLSQRTDLSVHMRTHGATRQHSCATCGRRFLRLSSLARHNKFVHRDGDIRCADCDARFTSRKLWSRHRASHKK